MLLCCEALYGLLAVVVIQLSVPVSSLGCSLPAGPNVNDALQSLVTSADKTLVNTTLHNSHFTCVAVVRSERYQYLSVAVNYSKSTGGSDLFTAQFTMQCSGGVFIGEGSLKESPLETVFTTETRRDCHLCAESTTFEMDNITHCSYCSSFCQNLGQGACLSDGIIDCCPFFDQSGGCINSCPANYTATVNSDWICVCNLSCPLGYEPDSSCSSCEPVHVCIIDNPCLNGSTCLINGTTTAEYTCLCSDSFTGDNCSVCSLECEKGYEAAHNCSACEPVHICTTNDPCLNEGSCIISSSNSTDYSCACGGSFVGTNCEVCGLECSDGYEVTANCTYCLAVNICVTKQPCKNRASCVVSNVTSDYKCLCSEGFHGRDCELSVCDPSPCQNGGTCSPIYEDDYNCSCAPLWTGKNCSLCAVMNCVECDEAVGCLVCEDGYTAERSTRQCAAVVLSWVWIPIVPAAVLAALVGVGSALLLCWNKTNKISPEVEAKTSQTGPPTNDQTQTDRLLTNQA